MQASPLCEQFNPEGLYATLGGALVSVIIGLYFGRTLLHAPAQTAAGV